jgi:hypothetical protein
MSKGSLDSFIIVIITTETNNSCRQEEKCHGSDVVTIHLNLPPPFPNNPHTQNYLI